MPKPFRRSIEALLEISSDWHTPLLERLNKAQKHVCSEDKKLAIIKLRELLENNDECVHTITRTALVPAYLDINVIKHHLMKHEIEVPDAIEFQDGNLSVTTTMRGTKEFAVKRADENIQKAIRVGERHLVQQLEKKTF